MVDTFVNDLQVFFLNLSFVFFLYFIYHKFFEKESRQVLHELFLGLISGVSIILCMTFSISPTHEFNFDMRTIPFIIGALYGGRRVAISLFVVILTYRFYLGVSDGFYASVIIYSILLLYLYYKIPTFNKVSRAKEKVKITAIASCIGLMLLACILFFTVPKLSSPQIFSLVIFYFTQLFGIVFFVALIERSRIERLMLEELKKLEKLKIVGEIAASISHEVRNPLTVTRGFIQLLRDTNIPTDKKDMYINLSLEELDRAEEIITDYLTFAKPSLENIKILDVNEELEYVVKVVRPYAMMNNVHIVFDSITGLLIAGERQKLHQCLINLVKNGIEAMPDGGELSIKVYKNADKATIVIQDTGIGMTDEQLKRLGTPYYTTKNKGTGLGTMVVFSIIKVMQGEIDVRSKVGKGTSFEISFPLVK